MQHTFLTGDSRVGKSTIVRRYLASSGLVADGFVTYWVQGTDGWSLYLSPFGDGLVDERYLLARWVVDRARPVDSMTDIFDVQGSCILEQSGRRDVIVMDEIGRLESRALHFQRSIMAHVAGDVPILGVLRSPRGSHKVAQPGFIDVLRCSPSVSVREVTVDNRDQVLAHLLAAVG